MADDASVVRAAPVGDVGPYEVLRRLGSGGMAHIYVGRHRLIGRLVAIKVLHREHARSTNMRARILNEARAVASIDHPNVVRLYEIGQTDDGEVYLAMELLDGETLSERLRREGRLAPGKAVAIAREIAAALAAAHARAVVHRDLKPSNVMLESDPDGERVKVLDFGIAKLIEASDSGADDLTKTGAVVGTPTYMSPEQCRGTGEVDHRTDVYSLGVMLYRMVTGRAPFQSRGAGEIIGMHLHVTPKPPRQLVASLPESFEALILRCLAKQPADRYQTMDEVVQALASVARAADAAEAPTEPFDRPPPVEGSSVMLGQLGSSERSLVAELELEAPDEVPRLGRARPSWQLAAVLVAAVVVGSVAGVLWFRGRTVAPAPAAAGHVEDLVAPADEVVDDAPPTEAVIPLVVEVPAASRPEPSTHRAGAAAEAAEETAAVVEAEAGAVDEVPADATDEEIAGAADEVTAGAANQGHPSSAAKTAPEDASRGQASPGVERTAPRPSSRTRAPRRDAARAPLEREAPKREAPKREAPKRDAPKQDLPKYDFEKPVL